MPETPDMNTTGYIRQPVGYRIIHVICRRTYGNETKAQPTICKPTHLANWGYPKQERRIKAAMTVESENPARVRSARSSPRTVTPSTWQRGAVVVY